MFKSKKRQSKEEDFVPNLSWEADLVLNERASRLVAWRIAACAIAMAFAMAIALIFLIPLKQVAPYVVAVDKMTGEANVVSPVKEFVTTSAMNDKYWLKRFVIARERYKYPILQYDYDTVKALAGEKVWQAYSALWEGSDGLDKKLTDRVEIIPTVLSVTLNSNNIATVRYELRTRDARKPSEAPVTRFVATLRYSYALQMMKKESELIENPLGFTVDAYQSDPELTNSVSESKVTK
ncbi:type IV secretion system protein [Noviherbaspirillum sp.]|jgi:type IV secretion system protein VirB8|uniref:virB8 family protein n=1 Tax=Noviherbaspirillum sp. TaxID=1926288 RepID=UPI0025FB9684|nr:type IV secretion system protein [Noviherbaspirillum sp.]